MAVGATHLTIVDLEFEPDQTNPLASERRHATGLGAHVVEVQNADIPLSAVLAARPLEIAVGEREIARGFMAFGRRRPPPLLCSPTPASPTPGSPPMAVDADNLALLDFLAEEPHRVSRGREDGKVPALIADMVELEQERIGLPAVDAWMGSQMLIDEFTSPELPLSLRRR